MVRNRRGGHDPAGIVSGVLDALWPGVVTEMPEARSFP